MAVEHHLKLVEEILGAFKTMLGVDFQAYRNHVYRVVHLCFHKRGLNAEDKEKIQIAACFHDIGIWTDKTLDYLSPSKQAAEKYLVEAGREAWIPEVLEMIEMHHRIRSCKGSAYPLVEVFRRADVADFSLGVFRMGAPREQISLLKAAFPNSGFHNRLLQLGIKRLIKHPLNPLPMFRM